MNAKTTVKTTSYVIRYKNSPGVSYSQDGYSKFHARFHKKMNGKLRGPIYGLAQAREHLCEIRRHDDVEFEIVKRVVTETVVQTCKSKAKQ